MNTNRQKEIIDYITDNLYPTDYHIAQIVKFIYSNEYCITTDGNKDKWFKYNGTNWETSTTIKHEFKNRLSEDIPPILRDIRIRLRRDLWSNKLEEPFFQTLMKNALKIEQLMYDTRAKDKILHECESLLFVKELPTLK